MDTRSSPNAFPARSESPAAQEAAGGASSADPPRSEAQRAEDARRLSERVAQSAHTLADRIAPTVDRLKSQVAQAGTAIGRGAGQLGEIQDQWLVDSRASVRSHPLTWVAVAFVAGVVIGRLSSDD